MKNSCKRKNEHDMALQNKFNSFGYSLFIYISLKPPTDKKWRLYETFCLCNSEMALCNLMIGAKTTHLKSWQDVKVFHTTYELYNDWITLKLRIINTGILLLDKMTKLYDYKNHLIHFWILIFMLWTFLLKV